MKTRLSFLFVLPLIMLVLLGCRFSVGNFSRELVRGSGVSASEDRSISNVQRVSLRDIGNLTVIQGQTESLTIEADDNILPLIETEMRGRELIIQIKEGYSVRPDADIHYTLTVKELDRIAVSGAANVTMDALTSDKFSMTVSGAGNADFGSLDVNSLALEVSGTGRIEARDLQASDVRITSSGAGNFDLTGEAQKVSLTISGAGGFRGGDLKSDDVDVRISGMGDVTVWAEQSLTINVSGAGNVRYYGNPTVSQTMSGGGDIRNLGAH